MPDTKDLNPGLHPAAPVPERISLFQRIADSGFPVGASSNRSERNLEATLARLGAQEEQISVVERKLSKTLEVNTSLTREVHELTKLIHAAVTAPK